MNERTNADDDDDDDHEDDDDDDDNNNNDPNNDEGESCSLLVEGSRSVLVDALVECSR